MTAGSEKPNIATGIVNSPAPLKQLSIPEALVALDTDLSDFFKSFANDEYALWLGSAISRDRLPDVQELLGIVIENLRSTCDLTSPACPRKTALKSALQLTNLSPADQKNIDLTTPFSSWTHKNIILRDLEKKYSTVLEITVPPEDLDYLYWTILDVANTYADPETLPDSEHFCIAILALEGSVSRMATANWDPLIEKAMRKLGGPNVSLVSCVDGTETRGSSPDTIIIKFHGCALKARENPNNYRSWIVANKSDIDGWASKPTKVNMRHELSSVLMTKKTLMVGLSAQDPNIRALFPAIISTFPWAWPSIPPACIFATPELNDDQKSVLRNIYPGTFLATNQAEIEEKSRIPIYAKDFFLSLVINLYCQKFITFLESIPDHILVTAERVLLSQGIRYIRDHLGAKAGAGNRYDFSIQLITALSAGLAFFRHGILPVPGVAEYEVVTKTSAIRATQDAGFSSTGMQELSVVLALLGRGLQEGFWSLKLDSLTGVPGFSVTSETGTTYISMALNDRSYMRTPKPSERWFSNSGTRNC